MWLSHNISLILVYHFKWGANNAAAQVLFVIVLRLTCKTNSVDFNIVSIIIILYL